MTLNNNKRSISELWKPYLCWKFLQKHYLLHFTGKEIYSVLIAIFSLILNLSEWRSFEIFTTLSLEQKELFIQLKKY